ncbi:hypothetical protein GUJ93_ZPchr0013g37625 [Zizania palustris]|uniref:Uncharacterized protein n=1 Tax=Zizania palustris TaxID=103762 RepID=A0A8J5WWE0_ZIZPA|nr:hypothetical protein GUJ93_ZPchr0013g37625 [Zizania palustris]
MKVKDFHQSPYGCALTTLPYFFPKSSHRRLPTASGRPPPPPDRQPPPLGRCLPTSPVWALPPPEVIQSPAASSKRLQPLRSCHRWWKEGRKEDSGEAWMDHLPCSGSAHFSLRFLVR